MKIFFSFCLFFIVNVSFSQNTQYYDKVLNEILQKIVKENPKDRYYFESFKSIYNSSDGLFDTFIDCENDFSSFKQLEKNQDINISNKYTHYIVKKNIINNIFLGRRLKKIEIDNLFFDIDTNKYLLKVSFQGKEGETSVLIFFDDSKEKILNTCYSYSIY